MRDEPVIADLFVVKLWAAFLGLAIAIGAPAARAAEEFSVEQLEFFEKEVRPILAARCYECHGPETAEPKGGLRIDSREALLAGGDTGAAIVPGDAAGSLLISSVNYGDVYQMPPKSKMPAEEIAVLTKWVTSGAAWPRGEGARPKAPHEEFSIAERRDAHWAWRPIAAASVPEITSDSDWPRGPIDRFILAKLEEKGLSPAGEADSSALLRRVYFDLTGLPPTAEEAASYLAIDENERRAQYERIVDHLLASPAFGERFARHWLDLVRYAETRGHEFDYDAANAWQYRDYCLRAIDADLPYDQFVIEHVAGDLVAPARKNVQQGFNESVLATGFWHLGEWIHSPVDIRQDETDRFDNMVDVFSKTFLGLTVACARCHDHKFDAISQADYYALTGYLQSCDYRQARFETMEQHRAIALELAALEAEWRPKLLAGIGEALEGRLDRASDYLLAAGSALRGAAPPIATSGGLSPKRIEQWTALLRQARDDSEHPLHAFAIASVAATSENEPIDAAVAPFIDKQAPPAVSGRSIVDYSVGAAPPFAADGPTFGNGPKKAGDLLAPISGDAKTLAFAEYGAARRDPRWKPLRLAGGVQGEAGKMAGVDRAGKTLRTPTVTLENGNLYYLVRGAGYAYAVVDSHRMVNGPLHGELWLEFDAGAKPKWVHHPLAAYAGHGAHVEFIARGDDELEILQVVEAATPPAEHVAPKSLLRETLRNSGGSLSALAAGYARLFDESAEIAAKGELDRGADGGERARIVNSLLKSELAPEGDELPKLVAEFDEALRSILAKVTWESRTALAMWDGDGVDDHLLIRGNAKTPGPTVERGMLEAICGPRGETAAPGSGRLELAERLVAPDNPFVSRVMVNRLWHHLFGQGLVPSVDNFGVLGQPPTHPELLDYLAAEFMRDGWSVKRMVREMVLSSTYAMSSGASQHEAADPTNQWLHRARLRRLEAEPIRDELLAVSGRLDRRRFGPSTPIHLTPFLQGRGRPGDSGPVDGAGRRSLYLSTRRNFLSPMMLAFDAPIPLGTVGKRNVSNVPAQALIMLNDPLVIEQAGLWAREVLASEASLEGRLEAMYLAAFSRRPTAKETAKAQAFLQSQGEQYGLSAETAANDERVWTDLCHVLFNAKEFIFLN